MHVAPADLRAVRQDGITIRFALLGDMAYILAEIPRTGSAGTSIESPCVRAHWGFVIEGELTYIAKGRRLAIPAGRAFHVPAGGPEHRFESAGAALVAGFQPVEPELDVSDHQLITQGFELIPRPVSTTVVPSIGPRPVERGSVAAEAWPMSAYVLSRVRMGERSGYTTNWCDAPHWGLVTSGRLAIEWEDDVEILAKGDVFHCPAGPPGHRLEAADPATLIDLTPVADLRSATRLADWRRETTVPEPTRRGIAVAALG